MSDEQGFDMKALANRVEVEEHLEWAWTAFWDLNSDRQIGFGGSGPIMWVSIDAYARRHRIREERFDRLVSFLRAMDSVWSKYLDDKTPKSKS